MNHLMQAFAVVGLCATLSTPSWSQTNGAPENLPDPPREDVSIASDTKLREVLTANKVALTIKAKQLDASWRVLSLSGINDNNYYYDEYGNYVRGGGEYFTRGLIVRVAGEPFLVAYQPLKSQTKLQTPAEYRAGQMAMTSGLSTESTLSLALIKTLNVSAIKNARPFDKRVLKEPVKGNEVPNHYFYALSQKQLQKVYAALYRYREDTLGYLPPMTTSALARKALAPYAENDAIFTQPGTTQPFLTNPILSGKLWAHLSRRGYMVAFYEPDAAADGKRTVLFLNGKVQRVDEKQWARLRHISKLDEDESTSK